MQLAIEIATGGNFARCHREEYRLVRLEIVH